jgi:hypothetical protein
MIHHRYIHTPEGKYYFVINNYLGLAKMYRKFQEGVFGNCPRALCDN